jgi:hypothetical protein
MVRQLGELYATGEYSAARLAVQFGLHTDAVHEMLQCPVYAGFIACNDHIYQGKHIAIWPPELWARIQATHEQRSRRRGRAISATPRLLTGLLMCAGCGAPLWAHSRERYRCSTLATKQPGPIDGLVCVGGITPTAPIEQVVIAMLGGLAGIPGLLADVNQAIGHSATQSPVRRGRTDLALAQLKKRFLDDKISSAEYEHQKRVLESEAQSEPISLLVPDPKIARRLLLNLPALIQAAAPEELRPVVQELITEVYVRKQDVIAIRPTVIGSDIFGAATVRGDEWLWQLEHGAVCPPGPPTRTF